MSMLDVLSPHQAYEFFFKTVNQDDVNFDIVEDTTTEVKAEAEESKSTELNMSRKPFDNLEKDDLKNAENSGLQTVADNGGLIKEMVKDEFIMKFPNNTIKLDIVELDDDDLKKLQSITNTEEIITKSDEEILVRKLSSDSLELDLNRLSEVELTNVEENDVDVDVEKVKDKENQEDIISESEDGKHCNF